jgi:hypothetical protein
MHFAQQQTTAGYQCVSESTLTMIQGPLNFVMGKGNEWCSTTGTVPQYWLFNATASTANVIFTLYKNVVLKISETKWSGAKGGCQTG